MIVYRYIALVKITLFLKNFHWTYTVVGKLLSMQFGSSLLRAQGTKCDFVCCETQEAENYTQLVKCKTVDKPVLWWFPNTWDSHMHMNSVSCCSKGNNVTMFRQFSESFLWLFQYNFSHCWNIICRERDECGQINWGFFFFGREMVTSIL